MLHPPNIRKRANSASTAQSAPPPITRLASQTNERTLIEGTTKFALAQLSSKILTFSLNQILLRFLSASKLGVASQIDLVCSTIMSLSRDGIRTANQRQNNVKYRYQSEFTTDGRPIIDTESGRMQETVNLGYISVGLGACLLHLITFVLLLKGSWPKTAVIIVYLACLIELAQEPMFLCLQQQMKLSTRAVSESIANFTKITVVCVFIVLFKTSPFLSFAIGQLAFSVVLFYANLRECLHSTKGLEFSLLPTKIWTSNSQIQLIFITNANKTGILEFTKQQVMKYLLTEGDRIAVSFLATLEEQGEYALCCNYGSLIVRFLFFPLEEGLRAYFGRHDDPLVLNTVLRAYSYLGMLSIGFGPLVAPYAMNVLVKKSGFSSAGKVLSAYCYYIPLMAWNGCIEAYIQATASLKDIKVQAGVMLIVFSVFVLNTYLFLSILQIGAVGLVYAQILSSIIRMTFSITHSKVNKNCLPNVYITIASFSGILLARRCGVASTFVDVLVLTLISAVLLFAIMVAERRAIIGSYQQIRKTK